MTRIKSTFLTLLVVLLSPMAANADPILEAGDAGDLIPSAQHVGPGVDSIIGVLTTGDVDLFALNLAAGLFTASTIGGSSADTQLWLFDSSGFGIVANDDDINQQSFISAILSEGTYFLGISVFNVDPFSSGGAIFPDFQFCCNHGISGPTGPGGGSALTNWQSLSGAGTQTGTYTISLNQHTVPEPGTLALLGIGFAGMGLARRRRKI